MLDSVGLVDNSCLFSHLFCTTKIIFILQFPCFSKAVSPVVHTHMPLDIQHFGKSITVLLTKNYCNAICSRPTVPDAMEICLVLQYFPVRPELV